MVDLTMMARLLEAVRPETRLVLVGDPDQLTSVGAGAVLADLVDGSAPSADSPVAGCPQPPAPLRDIGGWPTRSATPATPTRCSTALRSGATQVEFVETDDPAAVLRQPLLDAGAAGARPPCAGDADGAHRGARPPPAALRPPRGALRRTPLEPAGRAAGSREATGEPICGTLVRRPPAAGHRQRLRARHLQRRDRCGRCRRRSAAGADRRRRHGLTRPRARPARRDRDDARDDHPQEPGQPGRARSPCCCPTRTRGC